jgi:hypothetical protein
VAHQELRHRGVESADDWLRRAVEDARQSSSGHSIFRGAPDVIDAAIEGLEASAEEADHFVGLASYSLIAIAGEEFEECLYEALHAYAEMPADVA